MAYDSSTASMIGAEAERAYEEADAVRERLTRVEHDPAERRSRLADRETRTFRYSAPLRALYGKVRAWLGCSS